MLGLKLKALIVHMLFALALLPSSTVSMPGHAFWRIECMGRIGNARIDPVIAPSIASEHVHSLKGASSASRKNKAERHFILAADPRCQL